MNNTIQERVDELELYYKPIKHLAVIRVVLFWFIAGLSLLMPYSASIAPSLLRISLQPIFIIIVLLYFVLSQFSRFYLIPRAERNRRKQLLSDSFGVPLSHDRTCLYYNNEYSPSVQRLGANTMENAFFSKEVAANMLLKTRIVTGTYFTIWIFAFALRHNNLEILTWITQLVFSSQIVAQWLNLEVLHCSYERIYENLHIHFLNEISENSPQSVATVIDAFVEYEASKSSAGILLSTKLFKRLNPTLTRKWNEIRHELHMDFQHNVGPDREGSHR